MADIKIREGKKISADEAKGLDRSKMGVMLTGGVEVEGQDIYAGYTKCPWCGNIGRSIIDTDAYHWYTCGACGRAFRA
jgi:predicted RNA-binding Zn-ribbon protein involved in translation (DUF1610 family)